MDKADVGRLFKAIKHFYPNIDVGIEKVNAWYDILQHDNPTVIWQNLHRHVRREKYPPTIAELLGQPSLGPQSTEVILDENDPIVQEIRKLNEAYQDE